MRKYLNLIKSRKIKENFLSKRILSQEIKVIVLLRILIILKVLTILKILLNLIMMNWYNLGKFKTINMNGDTSISLCNKKVRNL